MGFNDEFPERELPYDKVLRRGWAPVYYRRAVRQFGGLNPFGEPYYRMVLADCIIELHGGNWLDWPEGLTLQEMGGTPLTATGEVKKHVLELKDKNLPTQELATEVLKLVPSEQQPLRRVKEMRLVKRYPYLTGWMLQSWRPPEQFGSKEYWESHVVEGRPDLPILGPFPERGGYEAIDHMEHGPNGTVISRTTYSELPSLSNLQRSIEFMEMSKYREREGATFGARMLIKLHDYERSLEANRKQAEQQRSEYLTELLKPYLSNSLEGGRLRTVAAEQAGMKSHLGN